MKKLLKLGLVFALLAAVTTGCSQEVEKSDKKVLTVATAAPYAPYETMNIDGELEGFDIDLGNAIAEKLGYELEWKNLDFDAALFEVQGGSVDMMMAGLSPSEERREVMDFSDIYYSEDSANVVVTLKETDYEDIDDLKGLVVGVQDGTIQQATVEGIADEYDLTMETRKQYIDIVLDILNGNIDFLVCEEANAAEFLAEYDELKAFDLGVGSALEGNAIGFKKDSKLVDEFNVAINELIEDGTVAELADKWFKELETE